MTNLHKHLKSKHPNKVDIEPENTGDMDNYVIREIPVSLFLYIKVIHII